MVAASGCTLGIVPHMAAAIMGLSALLPFFGTWVVWMPAAIWMIATGQVAKGAVLAVLGGTIVASIDNFLRPAVLSGRAQPPRCRSACRRGRAAAC